MKVSMQITLDGLLRALRWRAHNIAEDYSANGSAGRRIVRGGGKRRPGNQPAMRDRSNDRAGR